MMPTAQASPGAPVRLDTRHLPNAIRLCPQVISGGLPEGDEAFAELAELGVRTIVSVDGARPDVAAAERHGLRYVHLPHGYDGISQQRARELAKAVATLPGPIYIHCHHGKHRSPAAAVVACVETGLLAQQNALGVLSLAGTSPNYRGLYRAAESAQRIDPAELDALLVEFHSIVELPPMADAMVAIDQTTERLKQIAAAGWKPPAAHPDLDPAHEALLLREHFTELARQPDCQARSEAFRAGVAANETAAGKLETALREGQSPAVYDEAFQQTQRVCVDCHRKFRDVPRD
ncbi:MAG: hypothetical protein K1X74_07530 [Pirellulales bacterium]|nr:hypothetical protein [Pirellulales bacterium]